MTLSRIADKCRAADRLIARIDEREKSCAGGFTDSPEIKREHAGERISAAKSVEYPAQQAPTEAERAVDKYWAKYLPEIAKLQRAVHPLIEKGLI